MDQKDEADMREAEKNLSNKFTDFQDLYETFIRSELVRLYSK